jgi:predicted AlkP superfamily pyrophosphatase or phosphodiesterase
VRPRIAFVLFFILGNLSAAPRGDAGPAADTPAKKVLLIGIDGLRADAVKTGRMANLKGLIRTGAFADDTQILGERFRLSDTASAPGWSSILTGVWADKHGVQRAAFANTNFGQYPDFLSRLKRARPAARTAAFMSWESIARHIVTTVDVVKVCRPRKRSAAGYLEADRQVAETAGAHLVEGDPDALFVYFILPDAVGHRSGFHPTLPEYRTAIERVDELIGAVLRAMRGRRTFPREDWLVLVTSDHGGQGTHHHDGQWDPDVLTVFLIVAGPAARPGKIPGPTYIVDAAVTALTHLGVAIDPAWGLDGRAVGLLGK